MGRWREPPRGPTPSTIVDKLFDEGEDDDVIDAIDGIGSRVFNSVEDAKQFLLSQGLIEE